ncbi:unnamed protein product [Closterium sp. Naga37s-1]|nr:unnamed protein product [Closterium sp. Naga37s-1]
MFPQWCSAEQRLAQGGGRRRKWVWVCAGMAAAAVLLLAMLTQLTPPKPPEHPFTSTTTPTTSSSSSSSSTSPVPPRIAVCLVGGARDFELTGPSIVTRLLAGLASSSPSPSHASSPSSLSSSYAPTRPSPLPVLFLNSPLDENAHKLWALKWAVRPRSRTTDLPTRDHSSSSDGYSSSSTSEPPPLPLTSDIPPGTVSSELEALMGTVLLGAVNIFAPTWLNESALLHNRSSVLYGGTSPQGVQGLLQYFRLVETCIPLIRGYEWRHGVTFDWIVRTRVDTFWSAPLPPLSPLSSSSAPSSPPPPPPHSTGGLSSLLPPALRRWPFETVQKRPESGSGRLSGGGVGDGAAAVYAVAPAGESAGGGGTDLNSKKGLRAQLQVAGVRVGRVDVPFCVLSRRPYPADDAPVAALSSSAALLLTNVLVAAHSQPDLNSEKGLRAQLQVAGVRVGRVDVPFCVLSRRPYPDDDVLAAALSSSAPLNGAKCWPCTPAYTGLRVFFGGASRSGDSQVLALHARFHWTPGKLASEAEAKVGSLASQVLALHSSFPHCPPARKPANTGFRALLMYALTPPRPPTRWICLSPPMISAPQVRPNPPHALDPLYLPSIPPSAIRSPQILPLIPPTNHPPPLPLPQALLKYALIPPTRWIRSPSADWLNRPASPRGAVQLCDPTHPWEPAWPAAFDAAAGADLAALRRVVEDVGLEECERRFEEVRGEVGELCDPTHPWESDWPTAFDAAAGAELADLRRVVEDVGLEECVRRFEEVRFVLLCVSTRPWESAWPAAFDAAAGAELAALRVLLCDPTRSWDPAAWPTAFDKAVGADLAALRRVVEDFKSAADKWSALPIAAICHRSLLGPMHLLGPPSASLACMDAHSSSSNGGADEWSAPPIAAICHRALLGPMDLLGPPSASFYTATSPLSASSSLACTDPHSSSSSSRGGGGGSGSEGEGVGGEGTWEEEVVRRVLGVAVVHAALDEVSSSSSSAHRQRTPLDVLKVSGDVCSSENFQKRRTGRAHYTTTHVCLLSPSHLLLSPFLTRTFFPQLSLDGSDLPTLAALLRQHSLPPACQLLVAFPTDQPDSTTWRRDIVIGLEREQVYLAACVQEWWSAVERCTFFSVPHCSSLLLGVKKRTQTHGK